MRWKIVVERLPFGERERQGTKERSRTGGAYGPPDSAYVTNPHGEFGILPCAPMPLPIPKKPLKLCPLQKWQNVNQVMSRGDVGEGKTLSNGYSGGSCIGAISYLRPKICLRYAL